MLLQTCALQSLKINVYSILEQLWAPITADDGSQPFTFDLSFYQYESSEILQILCETSKE